MNQRWFAYLVILLMSLWTTAHAGVARGLGVSYGEAQNDVSIYRLDLLSRDYTFHRFADKSGSLVGHLELGFAVWDGSDQQEKYDKLIEVGVTPVFRLRAQKFYLEAGTGPHLITPNTLEKRDFSTTLQFGTLIGAGLLFNHDPIIELGFRKQHVSNGDISEPNPGIDFKLLQLRFRLNY